MRDKVLIAELPEQAAFIDRALAPRYANRQLVHTFDEAVKALQTSDFCLIISGLHFDDSRMVDLLAYAKQNPRSRDVPFICFRAHEVHDEIRASVQATHSVLGASGFIEVASLDTLGEAFLREKLADTLRSITFHRLKAFPKI